MTNFMDNKFEWCGYNWKSEMEGNRIMKSSTPWFWYDSDSVLKTDDNVLEFHIKKNPREIHYYDGNTYYPEMACGIIRSVEEFGYGTFSAEIMLPEGNNLWPSFWLSGSGNWPPEIDIMEGWTGNNSCFKFTTPYFPYINPSWRTTTDVHYNDELLEHKHVSSRNVSLFKQVKNPMYNFVKYECVWTESRIVFKVNGKTTRTIEGRVCEQLTKNIKNIDKGWKMNVIFNVFCENPQYNKVGMITPMLVKNFKYEQL